MRGSPAQPYDVPVTVRDYGQGHAPSGPATFSANANEPRPSNSPSQAGPTWMNQNPGAQVLGETVDPANHLSIGASDRDAMLESSRDAAQDGSYGTLVLSGGGRSKYLGPTAGSEWLRDVCEKTIGMVVELKRASPRIKMHQVRRLQSRLAHQVQ